MCFFALVIQSLPRKRFSNNVLRADLRRPWGRKKEKVFCYAITLEALLKDAFPNKFLRKFRHSVFKLAVNKLPVTVMECVVTHAHGNTPMLCRHL